MLMSWLPCSLLFTCWASGLDPVARPQDMSRLQVVQQLMKDHMLCLLRLWVAEGVRVQLVVLARKREHRVVPSAQTAAAVRALSHAQSPLSSSDSDASDSDLELSGLHEGQRDQQPYPVAHFEEAGNGSPFS